MKLHPSLPRHQGVVIDTMIWIYLFEDINPYATPAEYLVQAMQEGRFHGVVTPVTIAELIVKPLENGREDIADRYRQVLATAENLSMVPVDYHTGWLAGSMRAKYSMPLPDMFQIAVCLQYDYPLLITNDKLLKKIKEVNVLLLNEAVIH